jgi:GntR family transcriptional regulator
LRASKPAGIILKSFGPTKELAPQWKGVAQAAERAAFEIEGSEENAMDREWNDNQPIYRQLRDRVVAMILDGVLKEGDPLPSVRNVAAEYRVNPLTVLKGYQELVDEGLVETRRGRGMFINAGARDILLQGERQKFLAEEWPRLYATIQRLGLKPKELLEAGANGNLAHAEPKNASPADTISSSENPSSSNDPKKEDR